MWPKGLKTFAAKLCNELTGKEVSCRLSVQKLCACIAVWWQLLLPTWYPPKLSRYVTKVLGDMLRFTSESCRGATVSSWTKCGTVLTSSQSDTKRPFLVACLMSDFWLNRSSWTGRALSIAYTKSFTFTTSTECWPSKRAAQPDKGIVYQETASIWLSSCRALATAFTFPPLVLRKSLFSLPAKSEWPSLRAISEGVLPALSFSSAKQQRTRRPIPSFCDKMK